MDIKHLAKLNSAEIQLVSGGRCCNCGFEGTFIIIGLSIMTSCLGAIRLGVLLGDFNVYDHNAGSETLQYIWAIGMAFGIGGGFFLAGIVPLAHAGFSPNPNYRQISL